MAAEIKMTQQTLEISGVTDVVVTAIEQDADAGDYVRDIRIIGEPVSEGAAGPLLLQIRIRALTREELELTAPTQQF
jgi:hypothetical protein